MPFKKTILKLFWLYTIVLSLLSGALFFYFDKPIYLQLELDMKSSNCNDAIIYYNSTPEISLEPDHSIKIPIKNNNNFNKYLVSIPAPINYFRLDPCENQGNVNIQNISIKYKDKKINITPTEISKWLCYNCSFQNFDTYIGIASINNDPIIIGLNFNELIKEINVSFNYHLKSIIVNLIVILLLFPIIYLILRSALRVFILEFIIIYILLMVVMYQLYRQLGGMEKIITFFPPPSITAEKIVGFIHFNGYPYYAETIIINFFVFLPSLLLFLLIVIHKMLNKKRK